MQRGREGGREARKGKVTSIRQHTSRADKIHHTSTKHGSQLTQALARRHAGHIKHAKHTQHMPAHAGSTHMARILLCLCHSLGSQHGFGIFYPSRTSCIFMLRRQGHDRTITSTLLLPRSSSARTRGNTRGRSRGRRGSSGSGGSAGIPYDCRRGGDTTASR
jgi:uncharacterized membrane protein YgcG